MKSVNDLCEFLEIEFPDLEDHVLENIKKHKIDGQTFLQLNEEYLKEVAPPLGDRLKLKKVIAAGVERYLYHQASLSHQLPATSLPSVKSSDSVSIISDCFEVSRIYSSFCIHNFCVFY